MKKRLMIGLLVCVSFYLPVQAGILKKLKFLRWRNRTEILEREATRASFASVSELDAKKLNRRYKESIRLVERLSAREITLEEDDESWQQKKLCDRCSKCQDKLLTILTECLAQEDSDVEFV